MSKVLSISAVRFVEALLVMDRPPIAMVACNGACEFEAFDGLQASRGSQAVLEVASCDKIGLIHLAADMLNADGSETCWVLKTDSELGLVRVAFVTSFQNKRAMA